MYSFVQAELSDIRVVLQKVSGSQIVRAYHQKWWYAFFGWRKVVIGGIIIIIYETDD